jgi:hypothetical protein
MMQRVVVIYHRHFGINYWSQLQGSRIQVSEWCASTAAALWMCKYCSSALNVQVPQQRSECASTAAALWMCKYCSSTLNVIPSKSSFTWQEQNYFEGFTVLGRSAASCLPVKGCNNLRSALRKELLAQAHHMWAVRIPQNFSTAEW